MVSFREPENAEGEGNEKVMGIRVIPKTVLPEAIEEAEKRGLLGEPLEELRQLFDERPVWTKQALEFRTHCGKFMLKYILPCLAYFCLNGPWRSCWVRFGYDPRHHKSSFVYQLLDYRIPCKMHIHFYYLSSIYISIFIYNLSYFYNYFQLPTVPIWRKQRRKLKLTSPIDPHSYLQSAKCFIR